jgi:hypothetical protein
MNSALVDNVVRAVLYEGYILYPYRPSVKSRQRWTFGGLYPEQHCQTHANGSTSSMQTECLVRGNNDTSIDVLVRFLQIQARLIGELERPVKELPETSEPAFRIVENLRVGDRLLQTWQEAVEREQPLPSLRLGALADEDRELRFAYPSQCASEAVRDAGGDVVAVIQRVQQAVAGSLRLSAREFRPGLFRLTARIQNWTPMDECGPNQPDDGLMRSMASTHTVFAVRGGEFVSLMDPPDDCRDIAGECQNVGTFPVLVGTDGSKDTMLSSPIILYDYPEIAPESPGDLYDCTEIDEILSLRILTLTDEEKQAMAALDERARALLERTENLDNEELLGLHGTIRGLRPAQRSET